MVPHKIQCDMLQEMQNQRTDGGGVPAMDCNALGQQAGVRGQHQK
jgi:hypothetical protein